MFGLIAAGRMVQTNFVQVDTTKCVIDLPSPYEVNHIVVFLTGSQPFPEGYGGQIYLNLPNPTTYEVNCSLLGHLTNAKPSAIFKISNLKHTDSSVTHEFSGFVTNQSLIAAQIGIAVEPLMSIQDSTPVTSATPSNTSAFVEFSNKMLENFVNFITSFNSTGNSNDLIPFSVIRNWYENFQRRLQANPYFWRN